MSAGSLALAVKADEVPSGGRHFRVEANEADRRGLAEELGIEAVTALTAELDVRPVGVDAFSVKGRLTASVVQTDVVTLEPIPQTVEETIDLTLVPAERAPAAQQREGAEASENAEGPEVFHNGKLALGALVAEHLAVGLDPYPRAEGVEFTGHIEDDSAEASPFAALAKLKKDQQ